MAADHVVSQSMVHSVFGIAHSARDQHVMVAGACFVPYLGMGSRKKLLGAAFESMYTVDMSAAPHLLLFCSPTHVSMQ